MAERWPALFVTGTDTGVGKTLVSTALLLALRSRGLSPLGFKPIASGARRSADGLRNADALALRRASGRPIDYTLVNPYCFARRSRRTSPPNRRGSGSTSRVWIVPDNVWRAVAGRW
jgi:Dethiobiotin synthetase